MKVLSITPAFLPQIGGMEQVLLELAQRVRDYGICMDVAHVAPGLIRAAERVQDIDVHRVPLHGHRTFGWAPALGALARRYDLLHVHDPQLLAITTNVRLQCASLPAVLSTHGGFWHTNRYRRFKRFYERTLLRSAVNHYRRVLATSVGDLEYFKKYADRIALCSNGVNIQRFNTVPPWHGRNVHRWIYWGRLSRNKRVDLAIDTVAHARALGHPVQLLICGRDFDNLMPELHAQVARLSLGAAVHFVPFLDDAALLSELGERGVYITASEHEGFGLSIVEAMAAGLIVACRDLPPLNGFFAHGQAGWFLRFDGSRQDRLALEALLLTPPEKALAMSTAARQAASVHDWDVAAAQFVQHYGQVLQGVERIGLAPAR